MKIHIPVPSRSSGQGKHMSSPWDPFDSYRMKPILLLDYSLDLLLCLVRTNLPVKLVTIFISSFSRCKMSCSDSQLAHRVL